MPDKMKKIAVMGYQSVGKFKVLVSKSFKVLVSKSFKILVGK